MGGKAMVLVVDDELGSRESIRRVLKSQFDVLTADCGSKAMQLMRENDFDVAVLDIRMPDMTGIEALEQMREINPSLEVLMVTAYASLDTAKDAMRFGAYDYIEKPFNFKELREAVHKGVERKKSREAQLLEDSSEVREQLFQLEKLSSIGQMTSEVVHELASPLTGVLGFSGILLSQECDDSIKGSIEKINTEAERCQGIIRNLLSFARKSGEDRELININDIIQKTVDIKRHQLIINDIELIMELDPDLPEVMGDADQIQQVIVNIANNAHHAMSHYEGERRLTITTQSDSENVRVSIADTGPGIPQDKIDIIFEPFFTTKKSGEGTGLGLKISRDIIHEHDGEIYVDGREGEGARFTIELPLKVEVPQTQIS